MIRNNHNLEQLKLHNLNMSHSDIFTCVGENCPLLKHIDMHERSWVGITDESVRIMTLGCPLLESFQIGTDETVSHDFEGHHNYNTYPTVYLSNKTFFAIADSCRHFKYINIDSNDMVTFDYIGYNSLIYYSVNNLRAIYKGYKCCYKAPDFNVEEVASYIPRYKY